MTRTATTAPTGARAIAPQLGGLYAIWLREVKRAVRDRGQLIGGVSRPLLWVLIMGIGLNPYFRGEIYGEVRFVVPYTYLQFIFPAVIVLNIMYTSVQSAVSTIWDREFGFLREMMVAPVRRSSIVIGKCFGGATVASFQGVILLCLAWAVNVPYSVTLVVGVLVLQLLLAFSITAFGVMVAARIKQMQSFMGVMQMIVMPMFFISGALFPVTNLPAWLAFLNRIDPLTYAVDPMRRIVFNHLDITDAARKALDPGVTWFGWHVPAVLEAAVVLGLGLVMLSIAIVEFNATD
jgi:ABC-2 type transport system permease protein